MLTFPAVDEVVVEGEVARVTFESDRTGFRVIKVKAPGVKDPVSVVGEFPSVNAGSRVRVTGTLEQSPKHGAQIRATSVSRPMSCRVFFSSSKIRFSTTAWVAMPAWSVPGIHRAS